MTDLEISKALALAIGWKTNFVRINAGTSQDMVKCWVYTGYFWRQFDYRDWNVIGPIAEKYDCFPYKAYYGAWVTNMGQTNQDTPQKAIALAVIQGVAK